MMRRQQTIASRGGFTLVEVLAALAIGSVIIVATAALVHDVALHFDRGSRTVDIAERFILAVDRLAADFGSARQVARRTESGRAVAFTAETGSSQTPGKIVFVGAAPVASAPSGDQVVMLTFEQDGDVRRLVRRSAAWAGPNSSFEEAAPDNPVVLIEGKWDITFLLGRMAPEGALTWHPNWVGESTLPRFVRLLVRGASGRDVLGEADFVIRADAPAACGRPDAVVGCLAAGPGSPGEVGRPR
jgi:prepilin-type N-terminal cleavage/methylation domain-containing protein